MSKGKAPAFQFYVKDWLSSPDLRMCSCSTKGIWIDLLCYMWESRDRGEVEGMFPQFLKLTGSSEGELNVFFKEADLYGFCDVVTDSNGSITITNRRMSREEKSKKSNRMRQQKHRDNAKVTPDSNKKVTAPSSLASPSPKEKTSNGFDDFWKLYPKKIEKKKCLAIWKRRRLDIMIGDILVDIEKRINSKKWMDGYIPNPSTYLNGDRWEDEIVDGDTGKATQKHHRIPDDMTCGDCATGYGACGTGPRSIVCIKPVLAFTEKRV